MSKEKPTPEERTIAEANLDRLPDGKEPAAVAWELLLKKSHRQFHHVLSGMLGTYAICTHSTMCCVNEQK